jgi:hypothetical protein
MNGWEMTTHHGATLGKKAARALALSAAKLRIR